MDWSSISVVVVVRNGERFLAQALRSVLNQTLPPAEVIVVDGQSSDGTAAIASTTPGVRHLLQTGRGLADARNLGIETARGDLIAFLDHDDLWKPRKLEMQVGRMRSKPELAYTTSLMRFFVEPGTPPSARFTEAWLAPRVGCTPGSLVARAELFRTHGGFDTTLAMGCDADWFARVRDLHVPTEIVEEVLLEKRIHDDNLSRNIELNRREMFLVARRSIARQLGSG